MLSALSVLICRSTVRFLVSDIDASRLAHRALTRLCHHCRRHRQSAQAPAQTDQFTPLQLSLQPFGLSSEWKLKIDLK